MNLKKLIFSTIFLCCLMITSSMPTSLFASNDKMFTVGLSVWTGYPASVDGFKQAMTDGGFIEGSNINYLYGKSGSSKDKQRKIAQDFKAAGVDMVYSLTTPGTTIIKEILDPATPVVFSIVTYPADSGLIDSFEYSGNNLVGTSNYVPLRHYINLLQSVLPNTKSVAIFHRKGEPNSKIQSASIIRMLKKAGIRSFDLEPSSIDEVRQMALEIASKADVFMTTTDTLMQGGGEEVLIEISREKKIPILSSNKAGVEAGSTFGTVVDFFTLGKMSGEMAVRILRDNVDPARIESKLQDPPLILVNRESADSLGIQFSEQQMQSLVFVD